MWWRWVPKTSRVTLGRRIAASMVSKSLAIPLGAYVARRQLNEWLWKDGVDSNNSVDVRDMFFRELEFLEPLLQDQQFILGSHPSAADFGYFGSMFRHFGNDPVSAEVMRREGPNTYEWLARMWNARHSKLSQNIDWVWPEAEYWKPLLQRIARDYLPYLHQNALAFSQGKKRFDYRGESLTFTNTVTTDYRVWCRQELQREFSLLNTEDQQRLEQLFAPARGISSLHQDGVIDSGLGQHFQLPVNTQTIKYKPTLAQKLFGQPRN